MQNLQILIDLLADPAPEVSPRAIFSPRGPAPLIPLQDGAPQAEAAEPPISGLNTTGDSMQPLLYWTPSADSTPAPRFYTNQLPWLQSAIDDVEAREEEGREEQREGEGGQQKECQGMRQEAEIAEQVNSG